MTTIAYRDGILAADGRTTYGNTIFTDNNKKIHRLSDGALFALCGDVSYVQPMLDALEDDEAELPIAEEGSSFTAVIVEKNGKLRLYEGRGGYIALDAPYYAFGSGEEYAIGAMDMGASAEEAVKVASGRDLGTGGVIQIEKPGLPQQPRKRTK
jgi:ATP-dependent protease HslVU (ClpYQ) peptidase subunit